MKKLAAVFLTILFASSASAQVISNPSTNARMDGLGVQNWQIEDDFNLWVNPAQIGKYKNTIYGELGTYTKGSGVTSSLNTPDQNNIAPESQWGGMNMDANYGVWGVYIGRPYDGPLTELEGSGVGTAPSNNTVDLFYGTQGMPLGFYLSYANQSEKNKVGGVTDKDEASEINLGLGGIFGGGMIEAAVNLGMPSAKCDNTGGTIAATGCTAGDTFKDDAGLNFALLVRHHANVGGGKLLTTLRGVSSDASYKDTTTTTDKFDATRMEWNLGTALNSRPNADTLVIAGIGVNLINSEFKDKALGIKDTTDTLQIPVNVGLEHQTFRKLQTRLGISKNIYDTTTSKTTGGDKSDVVSDGPATVSAGIGLAVADNLMIDAVINQDILFTGTYVVSGVAETLSSKLSATYRFK